MKRTILVVDDETNMQAVMRLVLEEAGHVVRVADSGEAVATGHFRTPPADGFNGVRFGVTGDWRGDLRPFPAVH